jgi:hypothetical protein
MNVKKLSGVQYQQFLSKHLSQICAPIKHTWDFKELFPTPALTCSEVLEGDYCII